MRTCKTHRQYQHTHTSSSSDPPPLWNGAFCTLGCKTQSAHEAVANITLCVGPAFHGETIPLGGVPPHWQNLELEHIYSSYSAGLSTSIHSQGTSPNECPPTQDHSWSILLESGAVAGMSST